VFFYDRHLLWTILTTSFVALLFLLPYWMFFQMSDMYRGFFAGAGMRCGMFMGLYFAAIRSRIGMWNHNNAEA